MLNIFYSKTVAGCNKYIFNSLKNNRGQSQVVFTPDRMNFQIEQQLFTELNEDCFFDINVATLTRFANTIIAKNNSSSRVLTKPVCVALVKKILVENKDKFTTIKKAINYNGFASTLFDTISMFKSCNVTVDKVDTMTRNSNLNYKLSDIKLVYKYYEDFLKNDYTDSFNKLNLFAKLIKTEDFKNTHFYFVGFDDFTPQMYTIISALIKNSASVNVACAVNFIDELNNKNIFLNNIYLNLLDMCTTNGYKYNRIFCKDDFKDEYKLISNNLFALKPVHTNQQPQHIQMYKFNNNQDEVQFLIKKIQELIITKGISYSDINVVVPSISDYHNSLEKLFVAYNIPYFFDESQSINDSIVVRFYNDLFDLINSNFNRRELFGFLRNYSGLDCDSLNLYENTVMKSGYNYASILKPIPHLLVEGLEDVYSKLDIIAKFSSDLNNCTTMFDYIETIFKFTTEFQFNQFINDLNNQYKQHNNVLEYNKLNNVVIKVNNGFKELSEVLSDYVTNKKEAFSIISAYFENITVTMPPILSDSLFVTDINNTIDQKPYTFMLGLEDGKVPKVQMDLGLITDQDIGLLTNSYKLSPTINMINKRSKFRVYENILKCTNLYLSYVSVSASGDAIMPSEVINNMSSIFTGLKPINGSFIQHDYQNELTNGYFLFNNPNPSIAKTNLINNLKTMQVDNSLVVKSNTSNIYNAISDGGVDEYIKNVDKNNTVANLNNSDIFLSNDKVSVSEIEQYYSCPFKHFVERGLRLKENDKAEFDGRQYGNILHEYVKLVVEYINKNGETGLKEYSNKVFDDILNQDKYKYLLLNPNNSNDIKGLKKEIMRINNALLNISKSSQLKPQWLEKRCDGFKISNDNTSIILQGIIDRVDFDKDSFIIIDYKTGESDFSDYTDIVSGKKLQLMVYAYIVSNITGKTPIGVFYMPLKNIYSKGNSEELYKLKGAISSNLEDIFKVDKSLENTGVKSNIINVKRDDKGKVDGKILIDPETFQKLIDFTIDKVLKAVEDIRKGVIEPKPLMIDKKSTCQYCKYLAICQFSEDCHNEYNTFKKVTKTDFLNEGNNQ
ncbi:MAG: PD-(D/E)XK nuclease family protein [Eubacteriales bacterium]|nr:PD-(D/E)XK nuclease family protein [Eubacteriales bacterium]